MWIILIALKNVILFRSGFSFYNKILRMEEAVEISIGNPRLAIQTES